VESDSVEWLDNHPSPPGAGTGAPIRGGQALGAIDALAEAADGQRAMRQSLTNPPWFTLSLSAVVGVICAAQALPLWWMRGVVAAAFVAEAILLRLQAKRLRGLRPGWTWRQVAMAGLGCALVAVAMLACIDPLKGSPWAAAIGLGVAAVLSAWVLALHRVESRRGLADAAE
jgi:hypothetical protein